ncbi:hypothetical protein BSKO_12774 [Bryopsis sp. KO-2023]|nr:hypothetical protein BSKO_12774 [Bryopsis sp. KO-2023]
MENSTNDHSGLSQASLGPQKKKILMLHFNDVYNIEENASRFAWKVKEFKEENPLMLFSGDCFNPSMLSTVTRGKHMVPVLNALGVHTSCLGNHDLDFGVENFVTLAEQCNFQWLLANVLDKATGKPLGGLSPTRMFEWGGIRIGLVGLVESEWLTTLTTVEEDDVDFLDFVTEGRRIAQELRKEGAELVIALTHMRAPNDIKLLKNVQEIDIVMGGHDHGYQVEYVEPHGNLLVKSGTDFRDLTSLRVEIDGNGGRKYEWERHLINAEVPKDADMLEIVNQHTELIAARMDDVLGVSFTDLDGRFGKIRTSETNLGNFICDVLRTTVSTDVAFVNSGTFRSDRIHAAGNITKRDLTEILPMMDESIVLELTAEDLVGVLENSVSQYPKLEGRFLQISGFKFAFDPSKPAGERVLTDSIIMTETGEKLDRCKTYSAVTKAYLASGKDGYETLTSAKVLVASDDAVFLPSCLRNHFAKLEVLNAWHEKLGKEDLLVQRFVGRLKGRVDKCAEVELTKKSRIAVLHPGEHQYMISPMVEGRIRCVGGLVENDSA